MLPSAITSTRRALPMPKLSSGPPSSAGAPPQSNKLNILPSAIDALRSKPALDVIEHVKPSELPDIKDKKKGRPTKIEKLKEAKAKMSETLRDLLMKDPGKKQIREFFVSRIKELS